MRLQKWFGLAILAIVVIGLVPAWAIAAPVSQEEIGPNLLVDGDFEAPPGWPMQDGIGEIQVAPGWRAWYVDVPPCEPWQEGCFIMYPHNCLGSHDYGCFWMRPEFRDTIVESHANRVHSGQRAQKYFSFGRMHWAGLYQQVHNVPISATLRFSIYMQAWMCSDAKKGQCADGRVSDQPSDMHLKVGIDPTGGKDPFSPNIVWSREVPAWDQWVRFQVEAVAQSSTVTVFTHSLPQWDWARMNNDVYLDDAALVTVGPVPTPVPTPDAAVANQPQAQPQTQPQAQPQTQAQTITRPDGTRVHQVAYGDTLLGIALEHGITVDDVVRYNNLNPGDFLQIGQELIVGVPAGWTSPVSAPANPAPAAAANPATPEPVAVASAADSPAGLCVVAFDDQNMNSLYESNEGLVANTQFDVIDGSTVIKSYTTDGNEPYCFFDLKQGTYIVAAKPASGYTGTSVEKTGVSVASGQTVNVAFGSISTSSPATSKANDKAASSLMGAASSPPSSPNPIANAGGIFIITSGVVVLVLAGVVGTLMSRRS